MKIDVTKTADARQYSQKDRSTNAWMPVSSSDIRKAAVAGRNTNRISFAVPVKSRTAQLKTAR